MTTNKKIIIIEDQESWRDHFHTILKQLGENRDVIKIGMSDFFRHYNVDSDFDDVDFCFVDLELGPSLAELTDIWGLEKVLPHIRKLAPWTPTACISRFISGYPEIIGKLSVSDFDAFYPKETIIIKEDGRTRIHPEFNSQRWRNMLNTMTLKRVASMTGRTVEEVNVLLENFNKTDLILSSGIKFSEPDLIKFKKGVALMDFGGTTLSVDEILPGFSGVNVAKIGVYGELSKEKIQSYWLMKWGTSIRKLAREAAAHKLMFRRGFDRRLQIPQLYNNVLCWEDYGFIAYAFEEDAQTAFELLKQRGIDSFIPHLGIIAESLYSKTSHKPISPSKELLKWCGLDVSKQNIIDIDSLQHTLKVTETLIHGDFHLRNILVKDKSPTLIDFAKSENGPVAVDLAKLIIDIFVFYIPEEIKPEIFDWEYLIEKSKLSGILKIYKKYLSVPGDIKFFVMALKAFSAIYSSYPDVDKMGHIKDLLLESLDKAKNDRM